LENDWKNFQSEDILLTLFAAESAAAVQSAVQGDPCPGTLSPAENARYQTRRTAIPLETLFRAGRRFVP
jgi:hypothetical protein